MLDTNVGLSALVLNGGATASVRLAWQRRDILPLVSTETARELVRVLAYPKLRLDESRQQELLADYLPYCEAVRIPHPAPRVPVCRDRFDEPFLLLAAAGHADLLASGDADLLTIRQVGRCAIVTVADLLDRLAQPPA